MAKKAPVKKTTTKKTPAKKAPAKKAPAKKKAAGKKSELSPEQRYLVTQETAYYMAENDGFRTDAASYWIAAEKAINEGL